MLFSFGKTKKNGDCTDQAILEGLRKGDLSLDFDRAVKCLYQTRWPSILNLVARNSGTEADAEDVFQETILAFLENVLDKGKPLTGTLAVYFYIIARNHWFNALRQKGKTTGFRDTEPIDDPIDLDELLENERRYQALEACLADAEPRCRQIMTTMYQKDRSNMAEIADEYDLANAHTARQTKYRCLLRLKKCLLKKLSNPIPT